MGAGKGKSRRMRKTASLAIPNRQQRKEVAEIEEMFRSPLKPEKMVLTSKQQRGMIGPLLRSNKVDEYQRKVMLFYDQHGFFGANKIGAALRELDPRMLPQVFPVVEHLSEADKERVLASYWQNSQYFITEEFFYDHLKSELTWSWAQQQLHFPSLDQHVAHKRGLTKSAQEKAQMAVPPIKVEDEDLNRVDF